MRRVFMFLLLGAAVSSLALAQAPSTSNQAPEGFVPGPIDIIDGLGCPCTLGTAEVEANCGLPTDTVNGGCNSAPNVFGSIVPGERVCGTAEWNVTVPGFRDTDWYEYTVTTAGTYVWQVEAGFPAAVFIVDGNAGCGGLTVVASDFTTGCGDLGVASADLLPGTYWFFVAPDFGGPPATCGAEYGAALYADVPAQAIPTLGRLGLAAIALALVGLAFFLLRRRRTATA